LPEQSWRSWLPLLQGHIIEVSGAVDTSASGELESIGALAVADEVEARPVVRKEH
jgi:hypothetical protein